MTNICLLLQKTNSLSLYIFSALNASFACPKNWYEKSGTCYGIFIRNVSQTKAKQECVKAGADLVSFRTGSEDNFVYSVLFLEALKVSTVTKGFVWMGLEYNVNTKLVTWSDDTEVIITNWKKGQPGSVTGRSKLCAGMTYDISHQSFQVYIIIRTFREFNQYKRSLSTQIEQFVIGCTNKSKTKKKW